MPQRPLPVHTKARSLFAPFWYVDSATDSVVEVKNHLTRKLVTKLLLIRNDGSQIELPPFAIPPLATAPLALGPYVPRQNEGHGEARWGDGSAAGSAVGSAVLSAIEPEEAGASAFSAWILTEKGPAQFGVPTLFEDPADIVVSNRLEGIWWRPYQDARVLFSIQNASSGPATVETNLQIEGHSASAKVVIPPFGARHCDIADMLGMEAAPILGGITFSVNPDCPPVCATPVQLVGRARLVAERRRFAASLMLHQSLAGASTLQGTEIHAAAAYFGSLARLLGKSTVSMRPHLLMRNTGARPISIEILLHGKNRYGKPIVFALKPFKLDPQAVRHLDLEDERVARRSRLADGLAGVRVRHDGGLTDLLTELLNLEDGGPFAWYDAMKTLRLHTTTRQMAISFNVGGRNRSFLILKNTTDRRQRVRAILDYDEGARQYDVRVPTVPPQESVVIDVARLRDDRIRDRRGQLLPPDLRYGGAAVYHDPGAFVFSDPTFFIQPSHAGSKLEASPSTAAKRGARKRYE
jgi:hypothetical protein